MLIDYNEYIRNPNEDLLPISIHHYSIMRTKRPFFEVHNFIDHHWYYIINLVDLPFFTLPAKKYYQWIS